MAMQDPPLLYGGNGNYYEAYTPHDDWRARSPPPRQDDDPPSTCSELKTTTHTSYFDYDDNIELHFYGTHDPEEYLEWEEKMDNYFLHHQVHSKDKVKRSTRNFYNYAHTWWVHKPSTSRSRKSWSRLKRAMRREFLPSTLSEDLRPHLENTTQGSKTLEEYLVEMK